MLDLAWNWCLNPDYCGTGDADTICENCMDFNGPAERLRKAIPPGWDLSIFNEEYVDYPSSSYAYVIPKVLVRFRAPDNHAMMMSVSHHELMEFPDAAVDRIMTWMQEVAGSYHVDERYLDRKKKKLDSALNLGSSIGASIGNSFIPGGVGAVVGAAIGAVNSLKKAKVEQEQATTYGWTSQYDDPPEPAALKISFQETPLPDGKNRLIDLE